VTTRLRELSNMNACEKEGRNVEDSLFLFLKFPQTSDFLFTFAKKWK
jgi:hypothetical protein